MGHNHFFYEMIPFYVWLKGWGRPSFSVWLEKRLRDEMNGVFVPLTVSPNCHSLKNYGTYYQLIKNCCLDLILRRPPRPAVLRRRPGPSSALLHGAPTPAPDLLRHLLPRPCPPPSGPAAARRAALVPARYSHCSHTPRHPPQPAAAIPRARRRGPLPPSIRRRRWGGARKRRRDGVRSRQEGDVIREGRIDPTDLEGPSHPSF